MMTATLVQTRISWFIFDSALLLVLFLVSRFPFRALLREFRFWLLLLVFLFFFQALLTPGARLESLSWAPVSEEGLILGGLTCWRLGLILGYAVLFTAVTRPRELRDALIGYYLNELLLHLLPREDAHQKLFERYGEMLQRLAGHPEGKVEEADLRRFEKALLQELGYGLTLEVEQSGCPVEPEALYTYEIEHGPRLLEHARPDAQVYSGRSLLDLAAEDFSLVRSRTEAKLLMRSLMAHYLGGVELETRKIFRELQEL